MSFWNKFVDTCAKYEVLDLYFKVTDLVDFPETSDQKFERSFFDTMSRQEVTIDPDKPLGKQVF